MTSAKIEREQLQLASVRQWEAERQSRADAYAAVLTHLSAALAAIPSGDESARIFRSEIGHDVHGARGRLRAVLNETNPFVK